MERHGEQPWRANRARALRHNQSAAEFKLWDALRDRRLDGVKFTRQLPIGPYFADFACRSSKLAVEIDGETHSTQEELERDAQRAAFLRAEGWRMVRFTNDSVKTDIEGVLSSIAAALASDATTANSAVEQAAAPHPGPLPPRGEREKKEE